MLEELFEGSKIVEVDDKIPVEDDELTEEDRIGMDKENFDIYMYYFKKSKESKKLICENIDLLQRIFCKIADISANKPLINIADVEYGNLGYSLVRISNSLACDFAKLSKNLKTDKGWTKDNVGNLILALQVAEVLFDYQANIDKWVLETLHEDFSLELPTKILKMVSTVFPNFQYHKYQEIIASKRLRKEEKERRAAERAKKLQPREKAPEPPKEKEKTYKDYWQSLSREEQLAEISQRISLIEEYCARMEVVVNKLKDAGDPIYPEANKILQNNIKKRFYASNKDIANIDKYICSCNGEAMYDENGNILLNEAAITNSAIRGFFNKFENLNYECYKLDDLVGDVKLTNDEFTPTV